MRAFLIVSGIIFTFIACAWIVRLATAITVVVDGITIPVWVSVFPLAVGLLMATWAFRLVRRTPA